MMVHKGTVLLETSRLRLRRFTMADAADMFRNWVTDTEVTKYLMWPPHESIEVTKQVLTDWVSQYDKPSFYLWGIEVKESKTLIGSISAVKQDEATRMVHIGYCIGKAWWRMGYTSESLERLVQFFFQEVGMNRIESRHDPRNANSGKVMQKAGLRYEGTFYESDHNNQGICDAAHYALLARDYFRKHKAAQHDQISYRAATKNDLLIVTGLLCELYGMDRKEELLEETKQLFLDNKQGFFLAFAEGKPIGVMHVSLRNEYVNGKEYDKPCGYLEAIYVQQAYRLNGIAAAFVSLAEGWAKEHGCIELLSDCLLPNTDSYQFHLCLGFVESERCIFFRKDIK